MGAQAEARRRAATRAAVRYFLLAFLVVAFLSGLVVYALFNSRAQHAESRAIRVAYCVELEKLKTQNREDVHAAEKSYKRNLRLLGLKDSPELRKAVKAGWVKTLARNAPKSCPYTA